MHSNLPKMPPFLRGVPDRSASGMGHRDPAQRVSDFVLVATQRTGSTLLEELLSSVDDCYVFPELFSVHQPFHVSAKARRAGFVQESELTDFQEAVLTVQYGVYRTENDGDITLGAHLMWNQIADSLVERLIRRGQKALFLERTNILAIYRSATFAREKGLSHIRGNVPPGQQGKILYDHAKFTAFHKKICRFYDRARTLAEQYPTDIMSLRYDQLAQDKIGSVNQVRAFLGLPSTDQLASNLKKRQSSNLLEGFENPGDVRAGMRDLGLEGFLEPEY